MYKYIFYKTIENHFCIDYNLEKNNAKEMVVKNSSLAGKLQILKNKIIAKDNLTAARLYHQQIVNDNILLKNSVTYNDKKLLLPLAVIISAAINLRVNFTQLLISNYNVERFFYGFTINPKVYSEILYFYNVNQGMLIYNLANNLQQPKFFYKNFSIDFATLINFDNAPNYQLQQMLPEVLEM